MIDDIKSFLVLSIPTMFMFGIRHALDIDHIAAIDNLVRLHDANKRTRWIGTGFSIGHMISVLSEMLLIIYIIGNAASSKLNDLSIWGGIIGAVALASIGVINIYSMKKWGRTGSSILAGKVSARTGSVGPIGSSLITGLIFGLGFDTATQISALTLSAFASATVGIQIALVLAAAFAVGMIPVDTIDSIVLRSTFHKIFDKKCFQYMSYALSVVAITISAVSSYEIITSTKILPNLTGPVLAVVIIAVSFGYSFFTKNKKKIAYNVQNMKEQKIQKYGDISNGNHKPTKSTRTRN